ncbi:uncharacterized protein [Ptychodera flava]|uniref:uncharacterized protein n=1 Tax=Ptychodera flava TaxID=63121 RepID=UPI003969DEC0
MRLWRVTLALTFLATLYFVSKLDYRRRMEARQTYDKPMADLLKDLEARDIVPQIHKTSENVRPSVKNQRKINIVQNVRPDSSTSSTRYLLPLYLRGGGPNWQYNNFKAAIRLAIVSRRTIIPVSFMGHYSNHNDIRPFGDTFNVTELEKLLPVAKIDEFLSNCQGHVEAVLTPSTIFPTFIQMYENHYRKSASMLKTMWNISIPDYETVPSDNEARKELFVTSSEVKCLAIFHPINVFGLEVPDCIEYEPWVKIPNGLELELATYKHLQRTYDIKQMADIAMKKICNGNEYMAIHWRNKTGERCSKSSPDPQLCNDIAPMLTQITKTIMVDEISSIARENSLDCLYIARPSYSSDIEVYMKRKFNKVFTADDVLSIRDPRIFFLKDDNYRLSLVEQEICARSKVFGATWLSSWSKFVADERLASEKETIYFYKFPGLTEEIALHF